jgi:hypothetical protein
VSVAVRLAMMRLLPLSVKDWLLNSALAAHMRDPGRFDHGPAKSSFAGWIYFRVLCGIKG